MRNRCIYSSYLSTEVNSNGIPLHSALESSLWGHTPSEGGPPSGRRSETLWERTGGWTDSPPGSQACDHPSGCPDRQHALFLHTLQVKEVRAPMLAVLSTDSAQETQLPSEHLEESAADWATDAALLWQHCLVCLKVLESLRFTDLEYFTSVKLPGLLKHWFYFSLVKNLEGVSVWPEHTFSLEATGYESK